MILNVCAIDPELCFDVYRTNDRCVCGCSAIITSHQGVERGYCDQCAEKRKKFVSEIIGEIYIGEKGDYQYLLLSGIENIRKNILQERFYYMVDRFFGIHQYEDEFIEPYNDNKFISTVYREKHFLTEIFLNSIVLQSNKKGYNVLLNKNNAIYKYYKEELEQMAEIDHEKLEMLCTKFSEYTYKRNIQ